MADDLDRARPTEIAELQGEVSRLGALHGIPTPVSDALVRLVRDAESVGPDHPRWTGPQLRQALTTADAAKA
jgi:2-dehydropantoate 2-reductase